jgi:hypothetical protein
MYSGLYDNSTEQAQLTKVRLKLPAQITFQMKILCIALYKSYLCSQPCQILYLKFKEERTCLSKLQRLLTLVLTRVLLTILKKYALLNSDPNFGSFLQTPPWRASG